MRNVFRMMAVTGLVLVALPALAAAQDETCHSLHFRGNFRLNGAQQHIAQSDAAAYADVKRRMSNDALHTLNDAAQAGPEGGADPFTMWYLFGRAYLQLGDFAGADSALTRAAPLAATDEACQAEIRRLRRNAWVPLQQLAVGQIQSNNFDSALAILRRGNLIFRDDPGAYMNMAAAFLSLQKDDSAAGAFRMAMHAGTDAARADLRATAGLNAARIYHRAGRFADAEAVYREYIALKPRDMAARGALATTLSAQHRSAEAGAVYDSILANGDSLDSFQLFDTGVSLFNLAFSDSTRADTVQRQATFQRAARAFEASLRKNPNYRDAAYNLTKAYLVMGDNAQMLAAARRLVGLDSMSVEAWQLLAGAYQNVQRASFKRDSTLRSRGRDSLAAAQAAGAITRAYRDSTLQALQHRDSLPLQVTVSRFEPRDSTAAIRGAVQNLKTREHAPFTLAIEFLNVRGEVVATERVDVPALNAAGSPGQAYDFNLLTTGRGIIAYRYKVS